MSNPFESFPREHDPDSDLPQNPPGEQPARAGAAADLTGIHQMKKDELVAHCKRLGLSTEGSRQELVDRLRAQQ